MNKLKKFKNKEPWNSLFIDAIHNDIIKTTKGYPISTGTISWLVLLFPSRCLSFRKVKKSLGIINISAYTPIPNPKILGNMLSIVSAGCQLLNLKDNPEKHKAIDTKNSTINALNIILSHHSLNGAILT
ncbi:hypothetical protein [Xenorhabdus szentirmaii]|uniref:hypothetical protein n=1 Tax=Xenorhabdus szentirmaii TaxID=290112 RepID=UPI0019B4C15A|nr:hypothetical protein [Xenorhabdus sp. 38]MBD2782717.1 hypothetical protein [Xenorhabdus sp. 38]